MKQCHILSLSGGKDSTALALLIKEKFEDIHNKIEYVFFDTEAELPETYDYLNKLELFLNKKIKRIKPQKSFDHLWQMYKFLPSMKYRWCTINMKTATFHKYMNEKIKQGFEKINLYVGIRADEPKRIENYQKQNKENDNSILKTSYPLAQAGFGQKDVYNILTNTGIGYPDYYSWKSRSGCYFCFFQRKIEWVGLLERHPDLYQKALYYEKNANKGFTWIQNITLEEFKKRENIEKIKQNHKDRLKKMTPEQKLIDVFQENEEENYCPFCQK